MNGFDGIGQNRRFYRLQ